MNYFYRDSQDREVGPVSKSDLSQLRQTGLLSDETLVRAEVDSTWTEYSKAIVEPVSVDPVENVQSVATYPPSSKVDRLARAQKFSWLLFALAMLCFLLPFATVALQQQQIKIRGCFLAMGGEVESTNPVNGNLVMRTIAADPAVTLALALSVVAMLFALARKPFASLLGVLSGFVGVALLVMFKSSFTQAMAARSGAALAMREGFWLACALLSSGAAVQFVLVADAYANEGWRLQKKQYQIFACLALAVTIFYVGPLAYDKALNSAPSRQEFLSNLMPQRPLAFAPYKPVSTDFKYIETGEKASGKATVTFALQEPFYATDDFAKRAQEKGDDPEAFAKALALRNNLPSNLAPDIPANLPILLYSVAKPSGYQFTVALDIVANKQPRGWSFDDCVRAWANHRAWEIQPVTNWPDLPTDLSGLVTRGDLVKRGGVVLEDESTDRLLHSYIKDRVAFIKAVSSGEAVLPRQILEQTIADAAHAEITKTLFPASAYTVKMIKANLPDKLPSDQSALVVDVAVDIEQTDYLLRAAQEQSTKWPEFQPDSIFQRAKVIADSFSTKVTPPQPLEPLVFELVSSPHVTATKLQVEIKKQDDTSIVRNVAWPDSVDFANKSLFAYRDVQGNALLAGAQATDPKIPTVQDYRDQIQTFIQEISKEAALKNLTKSNNYFVKENPSDPKFDKFSYLDDSYFEIYSQQFTNSYISVWNAIAKVLTNNKELPLSYDLKFGEISTKYYNYDRGFFADDGEKRQRILLLNSADGVQVEVKTYICINWGNQSEAQVAGIYAAGLRDPRFHGTGNKYLIVPQFRNYNNAVWTMYPDTDESKRLSLEFLDQLATELKATP
jgi:hypothetical protein